MTLTGFVVLAIQIALGAWLGLMAFLFVFFSIPGAVEPFIINPNKHKPKDVEVPGPYRVSRAGLFTTLEPGQVKLRESWFGRFISGLMNWQGKMFQGEPDSNPLTPKEHEYWKVVNSHGYPDPSDPTGAKTINHPDSHPLPYPEPKVEWSLEWWVWIAYSPFSIIWWAWKRHVYRLTGAVWVGIPGFVTLHMYRFERLKKITRNDGSTAYMQYVDYSDHYKVNSFQFRLVVPTADTQDLVEITTTFNQVARVENPILVAYNTDKDWANLMVGANSDALSDFTRPRSYKEVIVSKKDGAKELTDHMTKVVDQNLNLTSLTPGAPTPAIGVNAGIRIEDTQLVDISPTDEKVAEVLSEPAKAAAYKEGRELRAEGDAAYIRKNGEALELYPQAASLALAQTQVQIADAAGDNALIFLNPPSTLDTMGAANNRELRRLQPPPPPAQGGPRT